MKKIDNSNKEIIDYETVVDDPSSDVLLKCTKGYSGSFNVGPGQILPYSYKKGDVLPRNQIALIEENWQIHNP